MALTKIDDRGLKTPIDLLDSEKIRLGTGNDLELYHDGSNGWLKNGTNTLILGSDLLELKNGAGTEAYLKGTANGAVELYYDNVKKLETASYGAVVTGTLQATGNIELFDNGKLYVGTGGDLQIYHDGSDSYIYNSTGTLYIRTARGGLLNAAGTEWGVLYTENAAVELFYDGSQKLETTSYGIKTPHYLQLGTSGTATANWHIGQENDGSFRFYNGNYGAGTEVLRVKYDGDLSIVNGNLAVASGHGIDFSATSDATGKTSELLDDYEEGTFTPTIGRGITAQTYLHQFGHYIKIGNKVHLDIYIVLDNVNADGNQYAIGGFPFNLKSANHIRGGGCSTYYDLDVNSSYGTNEKVVSLYGDAGSNLAGLWQGKVTTRGTSGTSNNMKYFIGFFEYICA